MVFHGLSSLGGKEGLRRENSGRTQQMYPGSLADTEGLILSLQEKEKKRKKKADFYETASCDQWGRSVFLCLLFCVMKMC